MNRAAVWRVRGVRCKENCHMLVLERTDVESPLCCQSSCGANAGDQWIANRNRHDDVNE
jgi:hypothetical protein